MSTNLWSFPHLLHATFTTAVMSNPLFQYSLLIEVYAFWDGSIGYFPTSELVSE